MTAVDALPLARGLADCNTAHLVIWIRFSFDHILRVVQGSSTGRQTLTSLLEQKSLVDLLEELLLELVEIILLDDIGLLWCRRDSDANDARIGKCLLEIGHLLLQDLVFTCESCILLLKLLSGLNECIDVLFLLVNLFFEGFLVGLLSESASDGGLSVLQSLSGLLIFDWVIEI